MGSYKKPTICDDKNILAYMRQFENEKYLIVVNNNPLEQEILVSKTQVKLKVLLNYNPIELKTLSLKMSPFSGVVLKVDW